MARKNILLIGHEGYLGSGLHAYFASNPFNVIGWGRKQELFSLDANHLRELKIDAVVNCAVVQDRASTRFIGGSPTDWVNVEGVRHLTEILMGLTIPLIQLSTKDVFGPVYRPEDLIEEADRFVPKFLVDESFPFDPRTVYAKSKLMGEWISESHSHATVIRLSACYTDFDHPRGNWICRMTRSYLRGEPLNISGNGKQFRDVLHVQDLGRLIRAVLEGDPAKAAGVKVNAGGGEANRVSIREFVSMLEAGGPPARVVTTAADDLGFAFDNRLARELWGWEPQVKLADRISLLKKNIGAGISAHGSATR